MLFAVDKYHVRLASYFRPSWHWLDFAIMLVFLGLQFRQGLRFTHWWFDRNESHRTRVTRLWWPPRLSSFFIVCGVAYFVVDWVQNPPMGSQLGIRLGWFGMILGFICRQYEQ